MNIDVTSLRIIITVVSLLIFVGICGWAYARRNRERFDEAAQLPFQSD